MIGLTAFGIGGVLWFFAMAGVAPLHAAAAADAGGGGTSCVGLSRPVPGPIIAPYAPIGRYEGHWGIDLAATLGTTVGAAADGRITFSGTVADNQTVTIDHGGGIRTSYSFLAERTVAAGTPVGRGRSLGRSGVAHGVDALHWSVRIGDVYQDPADFVGCRATGPGGAVHLVLRP